MDREGKDRAAKNEALFREVNERVRVIAEARDLPKGERWEFLCECGRRHDCVERFSMTRSDYERLRSNPTHFAVVPGHEQAEIERVVASSNGYLIVEKAPPADRVAVETDPRG